MRFKWLLVAILSAATANVSSADLAVALYDVYSPVTATFQNCTPIGETGWSHAPIYHPSPFARANGELGVMAHG